MRYTTGTEVVHTTTGATGVVIDPVDGYRVRVRWAGGRVSRVPVGDLRPAVRAMTSRQEEIERGLLRISSEIEEIFQTIAEEPSLGDGGVAEALIALENATSLARLRSNRAYETPSKTHKWFRDGANPMTCKRCGSTYASAKGAQPCPGLLSREQQREWARS